MQRQQLKGLIEKGNYRPEPELVASAMLRRRGVRELLVGPGISAAGRSHAAPADRRQAA
ncbi:MAG: hypothetical protein WDZ46_03255 [Solirubrobacterales bacterium]